LLEIILEGFNGNYDGSYTELNPTEDNRTYTSLYDLPECSSSVLSHQGAACAASASESDWNAVIDLGSENSVIGVVIGGRINCA
jgi:hypothetical protein